MESLNKSELVKGNTNALSDITGLVTDYHREIITVFIYIFLCGFISFFGAISNVINMMIFYKQGLDTTINISFFALSVTDLCSLLIQQLFNFYINPLSQYLQLPIVYLEVQYLTSGVPREVIARITCLITVYITAERCLCIAFPLKIKQIITTKRTKIVMCLIYGLTLISVLPLYATSFIGWRCYSDLNTTLLGLMVTTNSEAAQAAAYFIHGVAGVLSFLAVIVLTLILIRKLGEKSAWRKTANAMKESSESMSQKDRTTISMIVLIACILIICYTPAVLLAAVTFMVRDFAFGGRYYNLYYMLWSVAVLFENINSSVNIFLYLKMSTKYRQIFHEMFPKCKRLQQTIENSP